MPSLKIFLCFRLLPPGFEPRPWSALDLLRGIQPGESASFFGPSASLPSPPRRLCLLLGLVKQERTREDEPPALSDSVCDGPTSTSKSKSSKSSKTSLLASGFASSAFTTSLASVSRAATPWASGSLPPSSAPVSPPASSAARPPWARVHLSLYSLAFFFTRSYLTLKLSSSLLKRLFSLSCWLVTTSVLLLKSLYLCWISSSDFLLSRNLSEK
mmetsp:Transcript_4922/g.14727  ORF Transcript_4922/g.14727 Transcript_4922/m.14727 type:complete len:214 (-) Transcript_4922:364-1005(-)